MLLVLMRIIVNSKKEEFCNHKFCFVLLQTFHVAGLRLDRPCFLSKSTLGFIIFNVFMYVVFVVHLITTEVTDEHTKVGFSRKLRAYYKYTVKA